MRKPKKVSYVLIEESDSNMYEMLRELVNDHHEEIREARIALAWNTSWKPDVDGRVTLGKCKKASDLDRELAPYDFVIILRREFWEHGATTDEQRRALLDHELCHAARKYDSGGEPVYDERGNPVFRIRKHDIEEFTEVIQRHGIYKRDLERFAAALFRSKQRALPLESDDEVAERIARNPKVRQAIESLRPKPGSGIDSVSINVPGKKPVVLRAKERRSRS